MNKQMVIALVTSVVVIGWAFWVASPKSSDDANGTPAVGVIADGKQFIDISAKGGYSPRLFVAKAGMPTVLRVATNGTFDCSSSLVIPKLSYQKSLSPSGIEEVVIPAEQAQGVLQGTCSMGMYNFQIKFE